MDGIVCEIARDLSIQIQETFNDSNIIISVNSICKRTGQIDIIYLDKNEESTVKLYIELDNNNIPIFNLYNYDNIKVNIEGVRFDDILKYYDYKRVVRKHNLLQKEKMLDMMTN